MLLCRVCQRGAPAAAAWGRREVLTEIEQAEALRQPLVVLCLGLALVPGPRGSRRRRRRRRRRGRRRRRRGVLVVGLEVLLLLVLMVLGREVLLLSVLLRLLLLLLLVLRLVLMVLELVLVMVLLWLWVLPWRQRRPACGGPAGGGAGCGRLARCSALVNHHLLFFPLFPLQGSSRDGPDQDPPSIRSAEERVDQAPGTPEDEAAVGRQRGAGTDRLDSCLAGVVRRALRKGASDAGPAASCIPGPGL